MGRGRPRGNSTQRFIGRSVGKGLRGTKSPKIKFTSYIFFLLCVFILMWITLGDFYESLSIMQLVLIVTAPVFLLFS